MEMDQIIKQDVETIAKNLESFREKISGKTFLVTGGAGFLGSWVCDTAISLGAKVICVDNLVSGVATNVEHLMKNPNFEFISSDILNFDTDKKIDYIFHMASIASPPLYMEYPIETLDSNIFGTKRMLELAKKNNSSGFVFMSTSEVYGNPPDEFVPTPETFHGVVNSFGPRSVYDEGKRAAEAYCYSFFQKFKMPIRISRTFNTYGPRLDVKSRTSYGRALVKFISQAIDGQPISIYSDGKQTRSFCYITDQIEGLFRLILTEGVDGEVFNIGQEEEITIETLARMIVNFTGSSSIVETNTKPNYDLKDDPRRRCPNISKARLKLAYNPKVKLEVGLKRTIDWIKIHAEKEKEILKKNFRSGDIRGVYGKDLNEDTAKNIGKAYGTFIGGRDVFVGRDFRTSSKSLSKSLIDGLISVGCNVIDLGEVTSPVLYFAVAKNGNNGGIMVTASHNPPEWNGFKLCNQDGSLIVEGFGMENVFEIFASGKFLNNGKIGNVSSNVKIIDEYIDFVSGKIKANKKLKIVIDTGNGTGVLVAPKIFTKLGHEIILINEQPDGTFPSRPSDPKNGHLTKLKEEVLKNNADFGVAYDGDADRIGVIDESGDFIGNGNVMIMIFSKMYLESNPGSKIVFDICCSSAVEEYIRTNGGIPLVNRVGHGHIVNRMIKENAIFGGEFSNHLYFSDMFNFDDAVYASMKISELLSGTQMKLSDIVSLLPKYPNTDIFEIKCSDHLKFNVVDAVKNKIKKNGMKTLDIDGVKVFSDNGWALIRASNTQPVIKINAESNTYEDANRILENHAKIVQEEVINHENSNN